MKALFKIEFMISYFSNRSLLFSSSDLKLCDMCSIPKCPIQFYLLMKSTSEFAEVNVLKRYLSNDLSSAVPKCIFF